jgi:hypothetical protein
MATGTRIKGGKIRVLLETETPGVYAAPCGFNQRSMTLNKGLEEFELPDCDDPDAVTWLGRDATTLSMSISGEGILYQESVETWLEAFESSESIGVKVEIEFPAKTITWTGHMHVESFEPSGQEKRTATKTVSLQSDGAMTRVVTPAAS